MFESTADYKDGAAAFTPILGIEPPGIILFLSESDMKEGPKFGHPWILVREIKAKKDTIQVQCKFMFQGYFNPTCYYHLQVKFKDDNSKMIRTNQQSCFIFTVRMKQKPLLNS